MPTQDDISAYIPDAPVSFEFDIYSYPEPVMPEMPEMQMPDYPQMPTWEQMPKRPEFPPPPSFHHFW
jgi:hypothetical protein